MKTKCRISFRKQELLELVSLLEQQRIPYISSLLPGSDNPLISFEVFDNHPAWPTISALREQYHFSLLYTHVFSQKEIRSALWCRVGLVNHVGYPQPENEWLATRFTYEGYDAETKVHGRQVQSFRIKREPKLKNKQFMDLTWPQELFVKKEVVEKLEEIGATGYEVWDLLLHGTGQPANEVVQLAVPHTTKAKACLEGHATTWLTPTVTKYMPYQNPILSFTPALLQEKVDFLRSQEWFGEGGAWREIIISQKVVKLILDNGWRGISLAPVQIGPENKKI